MAGAGGRALAGQGRRGRGSAGRRGRRGGRGAGRACWAQGVGVVAQVRGLAGLKESGTFLAFAPVPRGSARHGSGDVDATTTTVLTSWRTSV